MTTDTPYFAVSHERIDLGADHSLIAITWTDDERPSGWMVYHSDRRDPMKECGCGVWVARRVMSDLWTLVSWEPLTIAPSILCGQCGDHGYIRNGRWESA